MGASNSCAWTAPQPRLHGVKRATCLCDAHARVPHVAANAPRRRGGGTRAGLHVSHGMCTGDGALTCVLYTMWSWRQLCMSLCADEPIRRARARVPQNWSVLNQQGRDRYFESCRNLCMAVRTPHRCANNRRLPWHYCNTGTRAPTAPCCTPSRGPGDAPGLCTHSHP